MQRLTWDLRYPGPWAPNTPAGGFGGPMVPPGKYSVRLTSGGQTITRTFDLKSDPRVAADGVTDGDHRRAGEVPAAGPRRDQRREETPAVNRAGDAEGRPEAGARSRRGRQLAVNTKYDHPLRELYAKVVTTPGIYTQGMLIDQLSNIQRMITQADQKIGKDAYDRYADLKEWRRGAVQEDRRLEPEHALGDRGAAERTGLSGDRRMCDFGHTRRW